MFEYNCPTTSMLQSKWDKTVLQTPEKESLGLLMKEPISYTCLVLELWGESSSIRYDVSQKVFKFLAQKEFINIYQESYRLFHEGDLSFMHVRIKCKPRHNHAMIAHIGSLISLNGLTLLELSTVSPGVEGFLVKPEHKNKGRMSDKYLT